MASLGSDLVREAEASLSDAEKSSIPQLASLSYTYRVV